jgi:hypothetical protein
MKAKAKDSCREMFSKLGILAIYSQYIFSTLFVVKHKDIFTINIELHKINTRQKLDLHIPSVSLTKVQKGVYYSGIALFNSVPLSIKKVTHNINKFKHELRTFLMEKSFILMKSILIGIINLILGFPSNYSFVFFVYIHQFFYIDFVIYLMLRQILCNISM